MANIEKHQKQPMEQIVDSGRPQTPRVRALRTDRGLYPVSRTMAVFTLWQRTSRPADHPSAEDLPATPHNFKRIHERVRLLNQQLAASGMPFRLRVV